MKKLLRHFFFMTLCFGLAGMAHASAVIPEPPASSPFISLVDIFSAVDSNGLNDAATHLPYGLYLQDDDRRNSYDFLQDIDKDSNANTIGSSHPVYYLFVKLDKHFIGYDVDYIVSPYETWETPGNFFGDHGGKDKIKEIILNLLAKAGGGKNEPATNAPVPAAVWLLGTGLVGLFSIRRRMNR